MYQVEKPANQLSLINPLADKIEEMKNPSQGQQNQHVFLALNGHLALVAFALGVG